MKTPSSWDFLTSRQAIERIPWSVHSCPEYMSAYDTKSSYTNMTSSSAKIKCPGQSTLLFARGPEIPFSTEKYWGLKAEEEEGSGHNTTGNSIWESFLTVLRLSFLFFNLTSIPFRDTGGGAQPMDGYSHNKQLKTEKNNCPSEVLKYMDRTGKEEIAVASFCFRDSL